MLLFVVSANAQDAIAGYFTESTVGAVPIYGQPGLRYGTTAISAVLTGTAKTLASPIIGYTSASNTNPRNAFNNSKIIVGVNITTAYSDVTAALAIQASPDGSTWTTIDSVSTDTHPNVTGLKLYKADLTGYYAAYWRLLFNSGGQTAGTTGKCKLVYLIP